MKLKSKNIDELLWKLNRARAAGTEDKIEVCSLPTWGEFKGRTHALFSWDTLSNDKNDHKFLIWAGNYWAICDGQQAGVAGY